MSNNDMRGKMAAMMGAFVLGSGGNQERPTDRNIYGQLLQKCDRTLAHDPNWPTTGFMRENYCKATAMDRGSHYVCVDLPEGTTESGKKYSPFWTETGQARSPEDATTWPLAGPWCICEWAYARMVLQNPHFEEMLHCDAINQWTIESYQLNNDAQAKALETICRKCDVISIATDQSLVNKCKRALAKKDEL